MRVIQPLCAKGFVAGNLCHPAFEKHLHDRRLSRKNSIHPLSNGKISKLRCTVLHLPLDQRIKTSVSPMDLAKFRLSKVNVSHLYELHDRVGHDEDLEVTEIRSSSPSSTSTVAGASSISTVTGGCAGLTGLTTGLKPKSEVAPASCPLSARSSPANLSM